MLGGGCMTLDKLYFVMNKAEYPLRTRDDLVKAVGQNRIAFEGHIMGGEEIAVHISRYPIRNVSEFFKDFFEEESEAYSTSEALLLGKFEAMIEH